MVEYLDKKVEKNQMEARCSFFLSLRVVYESP